MTVTLAVPNKGRLYEPTVGLLEDSGMGLVDRGSRQLFARTEIPDLKVIFARTWDIPTMVEVGAADLGVTGHDLVLESESDVEELLNLGYGSASMVVAAHEKSSIKSIEDVEEGAKVATEFPNLTRNYFENKGIDVDLTEVTGATEITPLIGMSDLIVDITSTGTTLRTHGLEVIDTMFETSVRLIANPQSLEKKGDKIGEVQTALESVIKARSQKLLLMNVPEDSISSIKKLMPGMSGPTVSRVEGDDLLAVQVVVRGSEVYDLVNRAKREGARDILVVPIERIIP